MAHKSISIGDYSVWLFVNTKHESRLEFALKDAEERNKREDHWYEHQLAAMLDEEFSEGWDSARIDESQLYGDVSYCVRASSLKELNHAINVCAIIFTKWIRRYKINQMPQS